MESDERAVPLLPRALIDTSVLYAVTLCDLVLRLAETGLFTAIWSEDIIGELHRNLELRIGTERATRRIEAMLGSGVLVEIEQAQYSALVSSMTNHPGDRHILAAAVAAKASIILTLNRRHFPDEAAQSLGIKIQVPDEFLLEFLNSEPGILADVIRSQANAMRRPPASVQHVLDALLLSAPSFTEEARRLVNRE